MPEYEVSVWFFVEAESEDEAGAKVKGALNISEGPPGSGLPGIVDWDVDSVDERSAAEVAFSREFGQREPGQS